MALNSEIIYRHLSSNYHVGKVKAILDAASKLGLTGGGIGMEHQRGQRALQGVQQREQVTTRGE
jgi:hypothetical protein